MEFLFGIFLTVLGGSDHASPDPTSMIYKGIMTGKKVIEKEQNKEMDDSIHEELHQMTKDSIYKIGDLK